MTLLHNLENIYYYSNDCYGNDDNKYGTDDDESSGDSDVYDVDPRMANKLHENDVKAFKYLKIENYTFTILNFDDAVAKYKRKNTQMATINEDNNDSNICDCPLSHDEGFFKVNFGYGGEGRKCDIFLSISIINSDTTKNGTTYTNTKYNDAITNVGTSINKFCNIMNEIETSNDKKSIKEYEIDESIKDNIRWIAGHKKESFGEFVIYVGNGNYGMKLDFGSSFDIKKKKQKQRLKLSTILSCLKMIQFVKKESKIDITVGISSSDRETADKALKQLKMKENGSGDIDGGVVVLYHLLARKHKSFGYVINNTQDCQTVIKCLYDYGSYDQETNMPNIPKEIDVVVL